MCVYVLLPKPQFMYTLHALQMNAFIFMCVSACPLPTCLLARKRVFIVKEKKQQQQRSMSKSVRVSVCVLLLCVCEKTGDRRKMLAKIKLI